MASTMSILEAVEVPWNGIDIDDFTQAITKTKKIFYEVFSEFEITSHISILHSWEAEEHFSLLFNINIKDVEDYKKYHEAKRRLDSFTIKRIVNPEK